MFPPSTCCPPNFLRPGLWAAESRPLRDEPTPFLCAITLYLDLFDLDLRKTLTVALLALVLLAPLHCEDDHLVGRSMADDRCGYGSIADRRIGDNAKDKRLIIDLRKRVGAYCRSSKRLPFFNRELLAPRLDCCLTHPITL